MNRRSFLGRIVAASAVAFVGFGEARAAAQVKKMPGFDLSYIDEALARTLGRHTKAMRERLLLYGDGSIELPTGVYRVEYTLRA